MRTIYKIAKTELKILFFSPIAWLIIIVFTFQTAFVFTDVFTRLVRGKTLGLEMSMLTLTTFASTSMGVFTFAQQYLFLYIPLLTMGVISRDFNSGSIKLLYSSPITSKQILFGKYLALMIFAFVLTSILACFGVYAAFSIDKVDIPTILSGLLGIFLLICAYAAIGLFMSSLTSYAVVSALGTLVIFAVLTYMPNLWQDIEFIRDITYWLSPADRGYTFKNGLITSEDILYFLVVIGMFLGFAIIKMQNSRQRKPWYIAIARYLAVFAITITIGYLSVQPQLMAYFDVTRTKINTLTKNSQDVMKRLENEKLFITTYTNMLDRHYYLALPEKYNTDGENFSSYMRFNPGMKRKYSYYYKKTENTPWTFQYPSLNEKQLVDTLIKLHEWEFAIYPYTAISKNINLEKEDFHFVRSITSSNGRQTFLRVYDDMERHPHESEITAAFKRLTIDKLPTVGFLTGHGERQSNGIDDRSYSRFAQQKSFRYALINQGFDFEDITLEKEIPERINIILIAELRKALTVDEMTHLNNYIVRGGNLIIAGEPGRQQFMNPVVEPLGALFLPGILVKQKEKFEANLLFSKATPSSENISFHFRDLKKQLKVLPMLNTCGLIFSEDKGFKVTTLFTGDSTGCWNELQTKDFVDDTAIYHPTTGEEKKVYPTVIALSRKLQNKEQKIIIMGDADCLSNGELNKGREKVFAANADFINGIFFWLTDGELPIDTRRETTPDQKIYPDKNSWIFSKLAIKWFLPASFMFTGLFILIKRKRQ